MFQHRCYKLSFLVSLLVFSFYSYGQSLAGDIKSCSTEENSLKRLVCYDDIAKRIDGNEQKAGKKNLEKTLKKSTLAVNESDWKSSDKNSEVEDFGKPASSPSFVEKGSLHAEVASIQELPSKRIRLTFTDGQVWEQTSSERTRRPKEGDKVIVTKGAFGAFYLNKQGSKRRMRVKRLD